MFVYQYFRDVLDRHVTVMGFCLHEPWDQVSPWLHFVGFGFQDFQGKASGENSIP